MMIAGIAVTAVGGGVAIAGAVMLALGIEKSGCLICSEAETSAAKPLEIAGGISLATGLFSAVTAGIPLIVLGSRRPSAGRADAPAIDVHFGATRLDITGAF